MQNVIKKSSFNFNKFQKSVTSKVKRDSYLSAERDSNVGRITIAKIVESKVERPGFMKIETVLRLCDWMEKPISEFIN